MINPPTGIIRTLPTLYRDPKNPGWRGLSRSLERCKLNDEATFYIALAQQPKQDVLHLYIVIGNEVMFRCNIAGYSPGTEAKCWDQSIRQPKIWVVCTGPIEYPPEPIRLRGFQGFRYTEELW